MAKRVEGKAAIEVGGGQTKGETVGNGPCRRARAGARGRCSVVVADRRLDSAQGTVDLIKRGGGDASACAPDVTDEEAVRRLIATALERLGRLDILHNSVGASLALGDAVAKPTSPRRRSTGASP
jgi:NAD(P)-dependent dehydrogenase (short-subunit alcohol dehydrogenase family)